MPEKKIINKRVFFCGFGQSHLREAMLDHLETHQYDFIVHLCIKEYLEELDAVYYTQKEGYRKEEFRGNPDNSLPPAEVLEHMQPVELLFLKMLDRTHKSPTPNRYYEYRKRLYLAQLTFAYSILTGYKIDQVLFSIIPHNPFDFILHNLAHYLGIRSQFFFQTRIIDSFILTSSLNGLFDPIDEVDNIELSDDAKFPEHLEAEILLRTQNKQPFYMSSKGLSLRQRFYNKQKRIIRLHSYTQFFYARKPKRIYKKLPKISAPPKEPFIYFPLHYQPEASTSPMGGVYVDQCLTIMTVSRSLPEGMVVVVKEHPAQRFWQRYPEFYQTLQKEKNIVFAEQTTDSNELTRKSFAVATITGTVAWESVFLKKPVWLFGVMFCEKVKGVLKINSQEDIRTAIRQIQDGTFPLSTDEDIRQFLLRFDQITLSGVTDEAYLRISALGRDACIENISSVLAKIAETP